MKKVLTILSLLSISLPATASQVDAAMNRLKGDTAYKASQADNRSVEDLVASGRQNAEAAAVLVIDGVENKNCLKMYQSAIKITEAIRLLKIAKLNDYYSTIPTRLFTDLGPAQVDLNKYLEFQDLVKSKATELCE